MNIGSDNWTYGYERVSTDDQDLSLQRDALLRAGVPARRIYYYVMIFLLVAALVGVAILLSEKARSLVLATWARIKTK